MKAFVNQPVPFSGSQAASGSNENGVIFASASRTAAAYTSAEHVNPGAKGIRLFITNDGGAGTSTATVKIQVKDPVGNTWTDLTGATTAALGVVTGSIITIYPDIAVTANVAVSQHLGYVWRAVLTIGAVTGVSSVGAEYLI